MGVFSSARTLKMKFLLLLLVAVQINFSYQGWCGYRPSWPLKKYDASNDMRMTFIADEPGSFDDYNQMEMTSNLDLKTGLFTAPDSREYVVTLTGLLYPAGGHFTVPSYAQLFVLRNGQLNSEYNYLLVHGTEVSETRFRIDLNKFDTLEVFVGHHMANTLMLDGSCETDTTRGQCRVNPFILHQVRFCIF